MVETRHVEREILLAFWKVHILHHAAEQPVYGQWVVRELRRHGYEVSPGTLYPLLARMERRGWLAAESNPAAGPRARRPYRLTEKGTEVLALVRQHVAELHREVVSEARGVRRADRMGRRKIEADSKLERLLKRKERRTT